jgi:hypothetical protein
MRLDNKHQTAVVEAVLPPPPYKSPMGSYVPVIPGGPGLYREVKPGIFLSAIHGGRRECNNQYQSHRGAR